MCVKQRSLNDTYGIFVFPCFPPSDPIQIFIDFISKHPPDTTMQIGCGCGKSLGCVFSFERKLISTQINLLNLKIAWTLYRVWIYTASAYICMLARTQHAVGSRLSAVIMRPTVYYLNLVPKPTKSPGAGPGYWTTKVLANAINAVSCQKESGLWPNRQQYWKSVQRG